MRLLSFKGQRMVDLLCPALSNFCHLHQIRMTLALILIDHINFKILIHNPHHYGLCLKDSLYYDSIPSIYLLMHTKH